MNNVLLFKIGSESRNMEHTVEYNNGEWSCTCEHHKYRGAECKHIKTAQKQLRAVAETGDHTIATNVVVEVEDTTSYRNLKNLLTLKKELNEEEVDVDRCKAIVEQLLLAI